VVTLSKYNIWVEGFRATGESAEAQFVATVEAKSFQKACDIIAKQKGWGDLYDKDRLTWWVCRLYDNEQEARKDFG
jgi:hypothetical protein